MDATFRFLVVVRQKSPRRRWDSSVAVLFGRESEREGGHGETNKGTQSDSMPGATKSAKVCNIPLVFAKNVQLQLWYVVY